MQSTNLRSKIYEGAKTKNLAIINVIIDRIENELSVVEKLDLMEYFWIYSLIADICNQNNWLRTPGRNTSCGSLVAYCLDITKVNPMEHNLIFERFVNPLLFGHADIDIDVPQGKKILLIEELKTLIPSYEISFVAFIPSENDPTDYKKVIIGGVEYCVHVCAVIINLIDTPINVAKANVDGVNYYVLNDKPNDYLKLDRYRYDILELGYLSKLETISNQLSSKFHPYNIDLSDKSTFDFLSSSSDFSNLFQLSNQIIKDAYVSFKPKNINELAIINSLAQPSTVHLIKQLIDNKSLGYQVKFKSDTRVDDLLKETYGVLIYQETFLLLLNTIASIEMQRAAWYSRVLMINKNVAQVNEFYNEFFEGCKKCSTLTDFEITELIELIKNNIGFLFLKSHALSYSTVSYWGAYYKVHFPNEFELAMSVNNKTQKNKCP